MTDATRARVPEAKVQAINMATSEVTSAITDSTGSYTIPLLRPGQYRLTVTASGFKQYVRENITLEISQTAGIDVTLEIGEINQRVEVTAAAALMDTQTGNRSGIIDSTEVAELPLNSGRNPFMLGLTQSGVTYRGASIWQRPFDNGAIASWVVNGSWQSNNEFLLDGAANNAQMGSNNIAYVPIVETVQEFTMMQNTYDAQYGHTMGGILNTVMKSGGNQFHGTAWEFLRRTPLDANTFQNTSIGADRITHYLDDYGGQVSGPIYIPKLLPKNSRIKLFYMGAFQNYREGTPDPLQDSFPTTEMRTGDFSKLVDAAGNKIIIYDPLTAKYDASGNIVTPRQPFGGNIIDPTRISDVAKAVTKYMPIPNTITPGVRYGRQNYLVSNLFDADKYYNLTLKFDWNFGDKHRVFFREGSNDRTENRPVNGLVGPGEDGQLPFQRLNDSYVLDWTATLSPTLVVDVRASNTRFIEKGTGKDNEGFDLTSLGLPKSLVSQLPQPQYFGYWKFSDSGYNNLGRYRSLNITNSYGLEGSLTKIWRNHTLKAGIDIRRIHYLQDDTGNILEIDAANGSWTQAVYNNAGNGLGGDSYAGFLLGYPTGGSSNYPPYPFWKQWYVAPFFQDDWKVNSRLTVNLGLRYDINAPVTEKYNRLVFAFDPNAASPLGPLVTANIAALKLNIPAQFASLYSNLANLKGSMEFAGVNGNPTKPAHTDLTAIQPRVGFAYRLSDKLVVRGGYGMYIVNPNNDWLITSGFSNSTGMITSNDGGRTPLPNLLSNPFPTGIQTPIGSSQGALSFAGKGFNWFNPDFHLPVSHQFSLGVQRLLTRNSTFEVSFVGNRVAHTQSNASWDRVSPDFYHSCSPLYGAATPAGFANPAAYCNQNVPNPFQGLAPFLGTSMYTNPTISLNQLNRPFPQFTGGTEYGFNAGHVWYNSMQVTYNHRVGHGLTLNANYTLSKQNERWGILDYYRNPVQYQEGLYYADRPHFIKLSTVYELPFGKGKHFLGDTHGLVGKLVSGWEINEFYTFAPVGEPANLPNGVLPLHDPKLSEVHWGANTVHLWGNCVLNQDDAGVVTALPYSLSAGCGTDFSKYDWMILPPNYRPNQTNSYRSPNIRVQGTYTLDASIGKMTQITERVRFQFRAEAFNVFNHWNYMLANVNTSATDPNFGSIIPHLLSTQASVNPRSIQLGFKVLW